MDNESSYNCSFLFSSLVDDHDPDSQDITFNKSEANSNSNSNSFKNTTPNPESKARKRPRNSDGHSDGFNPKKFFVKESIYNQDDDFYISPAALNANTTLEDVLVTKANIFNQPPEITEINEQCEIFRNDRGTVKLCIDGCLYIKNMKSGNTCYWQCVQKNLKNCHGCAVTYAVGEKHYLKRIRREHAHEPVVLNTRGFSKVYEKQLKNLKENLSDCRFTKNRWGNPKLVIDGYFYVRHSTKGQIYYWKCEQRGQCDSYIVTQRNTDGTHKMGRILREHSHQPKSDHEMKELRLSYIPKFSQSHLEQIKLSSKLNENRADIPNRNAKVADKNVKQVGQTTMKPLNKVKRIDEGDSSSSLTLFSPNMPKLLTLKSSYDQDEEQLDSDNSQTISQFNKKTQESVKSSLTTNNSSNSNASASNTSTVKSKISAKQKLQFKHIQSGEKCEFVFLIDGVLKMLLNGFAYEIIDECEGKSKSTWKCSGHNKIFVECAATADTVVFEGDHYFRGVRGKHNHPPCDEDEDDDDCDEDAENDYDQPDEALDDKEDLKYDSAEEIKNTSRDDSNNSFDLKFKNDNKAIEESNKVIDEVFDKCEFIVSKRGLPKLTREGYYYVRNSVNKNRSEITYWKCELKGKCTGTLVTVTKTDGFYVKSSKDHNHVPDPDKYSEPRIDKPEEVNLYFSETYSQMNEDSSEEQLILPDDTLNSNNLKQIKSEDLSERDFDKHVIKSDNHSSRIQEIKLELITTARGMPKIARNGYYYCKSSVNKNRHEITYWKCELKGQCKGFLISITKNDGYYFKSERSHSHPPDIDKYKAIRKCSFEELNNSFGTTFGQNNAKRSVSHSGYVNNRNQFITNHFPILRTSTSGSSNIYRNVKIKTETPIPNFNRNRLPTINNRNGTNFNNSKTEDNKIKANEMEDLPIVPEGGDPSMTYECEFIISCQGNPKLCLNGYMYTKNRDKNTNFYWNCERKKSIHCMGYCVTEVRNGKHIVKKIRAHNHKADLNREMLSKKLSNILQKVYAKPLWNPRKIIDVELSKLPSEIQRQLPKAYSIQRMVKRKVQEKVSNVKQSLLNGDYAPIPNVEPSTSRQPPPIQQPNRNIILQQNRKYSESVPIAQQLYNDEYNYNNLYNSNNRLNFRNNIYHNNDFHDERYDQSADNDINNQMDTDCTDTNYYQNNQFQEEYETEDVYNCEIKNEPIDDYGYQNFESEIDEQMDLSYGGGVDRNSWNNGSAFTNSYLHDETYDNYENINNDELPMTTAISSHSNPESTDNSQSQNSEIFNENQDQQNEKQTTQSVLLKAKIDTPITTDTPTSSNVVYKKNQIAKKRIRAPDPINY